MSYPGSPPPPPWANITGISRTVMKDNAQETLSNYDGNARPGEIVVDLTTDPPTPYIGNNDGQLTLLNTAGSYGNTQVGQYLAAGLVGNIVPSGNGTYSLGNSTNWWSNVWVTGNTLYIGGVPVGMSGNTLTVNGSPVAGLPLANGASNVNIATANGNVTVTTNGTYNWTFDDTGVLTLPSGGTLYSQGYTPSGAPGNTIILQPSGSGTITNQKLMLYPTAGDGDHLHMVTGNLYETELFLGSDNFYIKLANTGNIVVNSDDGTGNTAQWTFGTDGNLTLPGNTSNINYANGNSILDGYATVSSVYTSNTTSQSINVPSGGGTYYNASTLEIDYTAYTGASVLNFDIAYQAPLDANIGVSVSAVSTPLIQSNVNIELQANTGTAQTWTFGTDGNLTLPQGMVISGNVNFLGTDTALLNPTDNTPLSLFSSGTNGTITSFWTDDVGNLMTSNIAAIYTPLQGTQTVRIVNGNNGGNIAIYDFDNAGTFSTTSVSATGNITGNYFIGNGSQLSLINAATADILNTNGLTTVFYPTFVEDRTNQQTLRADVDLSYRTDNNTLTVGNLVISRSVVTTPVPLANLTPVAGARAFVNNANLAAAGNFGANISGGGSNTVPVWSDGVNWYIG